MFGSFAGSKEFGIFKGSDSPGGISGDPGRTPGGKIGPPGKNLNGESLACARSIG